ncbi:MULTISPECIES: cation-transporting P-type ATPase [unclassified Legionella]|uniref:cation-translocating P-type ATPase n=1 Tax=unclassified Legionella TaxID=2622702 RepID=UPI0010558033|nr:MULTISPECIES: cation-transporting P-type ATPase [unclassified Legionella]MDI9819754.1 cation-transporting P-type ATPase [Legionella sp. PL877]
MTPKITTIPSWHSRPFNDIQNEFVTSPKSGLTELEAKKRLIDSGYNELPSVAQRSAFARLVAQFKNILICILLVAALATLYLGKFIDASIIFGVVLINTLIGFIQEGKAERAIAAIREMLSPNATVRREDKRLIIPAKELVPGDWLILQAGDKVPADIRLYASKNLRIDEAILTGESNAVEKNTKEIPDNTPLAERTNMAFSGTLVTSGTGEGIVVATGIQTEIGKINQLLIKVKSITTPLLRKMAVFARWLSVFILTLAGLLFAIGFYLHQIPAHDMFMASVGIIVAAIPEGLPVILTVALAIGVQRMASRHVIIRRLPAVETLGSVSIICSDKTGTLTRNEMSVQQVCLAATDLHVSGTGYSSKGDFFINEKKTNPVANSDLIDLSTACVLCNDAEIDFYKNSKLDGDPMEGALLALAAKAGIYRQELKKTFLLTDSIPFDPKHRLMATLYQHGSKSTIYSKGAPEAIFKRCSFQLKDHQKIPFERNYWEEKVTEMAKLGLRTLAIAYKPLNTLKNTLKVNDIETDMILLGVVGIIDPPREEAIIAVKECHAANIRVKMITGDHAITALAIANQLGIGEGHQALTGDELNALDNSAFSEAIEHTNVFARTSPEDKLRLVKTMQEKGYVVAMTGDGVNDAPALKRADIGVAMGKKGTEVAKEASEMVITDDNFASIVAAVKEGRTVYDNLKKAILFLLPINGGETLSLAVAILFNFSLPFTPVQILWVNMTSSVALGLALAFEPSEPHIMKRPPAPPHEPLLSKYLVWRTVFVSIVFLFGVFGVFQWALWQGESIETARTMTVNTLVLLEIFYLFSSRYIHGPSFTWRGIHGTKPVLIAIGVVAMLQISFTYLPFMQFLFQTESLALSYGIGIGIIGVLGFIIVEFEKLTAIFIKENRTMHSNTNSNA